MSRVLLSASLAVSLLLWLPGTVFPIGHTMTDRSSRCSNLERSQPVAFDIPAMRAALADLTHWDVAGWKPPHIDQLQPEVFEARTQLNHRRYLGEYEARTNKVFVNLSCRCQAPDHPEALCQAVLFHELVHWGQHQSGADKGLSGQEQEQQALKYEIQYLETRLGVKDLYAPAPPTPADLPSHKTRVRLSRFQPRVSVQDSAGQRQWVWIITGAWSEVTSLRDYLGQAISHRGHWVGLEIFEVNPLNGSERVEAWWDAGYVRPDRTFPADPVYQGRWIRVK